MKNYKVCCEDIKHHNEYMMNIGANDSAEAIEIAHDRFTEQDDPNYQQVIAVYECVAYRANNQIKYLR